MAEMPTERGTSYRIGLPRERLTARSGEPAADTVEILTASTATRVIYALALLTLAVPGVNSTWVGLTLASGWLGLLALPVALLCLGRAVQVLARPRSLDAPAPVGIVRHLRALGLCLFAAGAASVVLVLFMRPLARTIWPGSSGNGIELYVVGIFVALVASLGPIGLLMFEFSRLRGFEQALRRPTSRTT